MLSNAMEVFCVSIRIQQEVHMCIDIVWKHSVSRHPVLLYDPDFKSNLRCVIWKV